MHGLGNDFAVFDARKQGLILNAATARAVAGRRRGIGCDQIIVIETGVGEADAFMRIVNADGSEVETCGNATRCVARLLFAETGKTTVKIGTKGGLRICTPADRGWIGVDMGAPVFDWDKIPLAGPADSNRFTLEADGTVFEASAVSMGNPHCVLFVDDAETAPVATLGAALETHPMFPNRTNVEFVTVRDETHLRMRVWERGAGITQACGSGACASAVAAHRRGLIHGSAHVELDGGVLDIYLRESDGHVLMTGPAALAFEGEVDLESLAD